MMKEYKFEPQSQMIDVLEGATINVEVKSVRVAYRYTNKCYKVENIGFGSLSRVEQNREQKGWDVRLRVCESAITRQ